MQDALHTASRTLRCWLKKRTSLNQDIRVIYIFKRDVMVVAEIIFVIYLDQLIPRDEKVYRERSPIHSADKIKCPVIFFQGLEDRVVPPSQSALMVETLKKTGVPVAYVEYPGESHGNNCHSSKVIKKKRFKLTRRLGFRRAENIKRTLDLKLWFYGQIFGFPVEGVEGVKIYNYPKQHSL